jgi:hypothetical protein
MQASFLDAPASTATPFALDTVKSWRSFRGYFDDVRWKIAEFRRHLPADVRADQDGRRIVVRSPERFEDWLGTVDTGGVLDTLRAFLGT